MRGLANKGLYLSLVGNEKTFGLNNTSAVLVEASKAF